MLKTIGAFVLAGVTTGFLLLSRSVSERASHVQAYEAVGLGAKRETVLWTLQQNGVNCGIDAAKPDAKECTFQDVRKVYVIKFDSSGDRVIQKWYTVKPAPPIL
jgi:hypothetical protein